MANTFFHIDAELITRNISFNRLISALQIMHTEHPADLKDLLLEQKHREGSNYCLIRAAWMAGSAIGVKIASVFPGNALENIPAIHAAYVLINGVSGIPICSIDGTSLTYYKTAADSALGSKFLARPSSKNMLMVGAGAMAEYLIDAHRAVHPNLNHIKIWNRSKKRRDKLVQKLKYNVNVEVCDNLPEGASWADIICCATMTTEPLIKGEWVKPGCHLDLVGAFRPDMREVDDSTITKGDVFVDSRETTLRDIGELLIPINNGIINECDVIADLFQLSQGKNGRTDNNQITIFKNGGGGHLDLMTALHIKEHCNP